MKFSYNLKKKIFKNKFFKTKLKNFSKLFIKNLFNLKNNFNFYNIFYIYKFLIKNIDISLKKKIIKKNKNLNLKSKFSKKIKNYILK